MANTFKDEIKEALQIAFDLGVQEGMKREHAMWVLAKIGQEIEHVQAVNISAERVHKTGENEHDTQTTASVGLRAEGA